MFTPFHAVLADVSGTIALHQARLQRPVIGVLPAYFPLEIIYAAGGYPVQLWGNRLIPRRADAHLQSYCCSVARSILELELSGGAHMVSAYAFTSLCDTLVNLREIYRRLFEKPTLALAIPVTQTENARKTYLKQNLNHLFADLEAICEKKITSDALDDAARLFGRCRKLQRRLYALRQSQPGLMKNHDFYAAIKAGFFLPPKVYGDMLEKLLADLAAKPLPAGNASRLLISGMVFDPIDAYRVFDELGIDIVADDFANGWRTAAKPDLKVENLVEGMIDFLFNPVPCCCVYNPEADRHRALIDQVRQSGADGVIFWYIKFCEPDAFDRPLLMDALKAAGIPSTFVEMELNTGGFHAVRTRIEAFCEMLQGTCDDPL